MTNNNVACSCPSGLPAAGDEIIICIVCNKRQHRACKIGFSALPRGGYKCRSCLAHIRSQAAKKGKAAATIKRAKAEGRQIGGHIRFKVTNAVAASRSRKASASAAVMSDNVPTAHMSIPRPSIETPDHTDASHVPAAKTVPAVDRTSIIAPKFTDTKMRHSLKRKRLIDEDSDDDAVEGNEFEEGGSEINVEVNSSDRHPATVATNVDADSAKRSQLTHRKVAKAVLASTSDKRKPTRYKLVSGPQRKYIATEKDASTPPAKSTTAPSLTGQQQLDIVKKDAMKKSHHVKPKKTQPAPAPAQQSRRATVAKATFPQHIIDEWINATERPKIMCHCEEGDKSERFDDFIICIVCKRLQHKVCMLGNITTETYVKGEFCTDCRRARLCTLYKAQQHAIQLANALMREESMNLRVFCETYLWSHYCLLPHGSATAAVREITATYNNEGKVKPIHPAPHDWTTTVVIQLQKMILSAGNAKETEYFQNGIRYNQRYLAATRELAVWMLHHGKYKGQLQTMGLLAEVLGLEEKGTFWKGR